MDKLTVALTSCSLFLAVTTLQLRKCLLHYAEDNNLIAEPREVCLQITNRSRGLLRRRHKPDEVQATVSFIRT
jgi:hypothetical protein